VVNAYFEPSGNVNAKSGAVDLRLPLHEKWKVLVEPEVLSVPRPIKYYVFATGSVTMEPALMEVDANFQ